MTARATWLTLSALKWRGLGFLDRLAMRGADLEALAHGDPAAVEGLAPAAVAKLLAARARFSLADHEAELAAHGLAATTPADAAWPARFREMTDAPLALYHRGPLPADEVLIGVVGTRAATPYGLSVAREMARGLARAGVVTISGLAQGIDGAAHRGALEGGGRTIAVLAGGAHACYPPGHAALFEDIAARGTVLSEVPPGVRTQRWMFPLRNRIVSALARALVVIEAPVASGALITARLAAEMGREVLVVPGPVTSPASAGSHQLVRDGAQLVTSATDVLAAVGVDSATPAVRTEDIVDGDARAVLALLGGDGLDTDVLLERTGFDPGRLYRVLLDLSASGVVSRVPGNRWMRVRPGRLGECVWGPAVGATYGGDARWMSP